VKVKLSPPFFPMDDLRGLYEDEGVGAMEGVGAGGGGEAAAGGGGGISRKVPWSPEEDASLRDAYMRVSAENPEPVRWSTIARLVPSRTSKQCRERWVHHLSPDVTKRAWTPEEDSILFEALKVHKTRWAAIARLLPGRTDHCVKNRYYPPKGRRERREGGGARGGGGGGWWEGGQKKKHLLGWVEQPGETEIGKFAKSEHATRR